MTGKAKIEGLTNTWYGFTAFSALASILANGIGIWSIGSAVVGMFFWWIVTWFLGRALVKKSSLVRSLLLLVSALFLVLGALSAGRSTLKFFSAWELNLLVTAFYSAVSAWMYGKSFRTLTDPSVKAYFN
jgi:hypothetical protein